MTSAVKLMYLPVSAVVSVVVKTGLAPRNPNYLQQFSTFNPAAQMCYDG